MREAPGSSGGRETIIYFVTLMPRAEYLSEEAMATTLSAAGLVPHGTLMVRRQLVAPPPPEEGPDQTDGVLREAAAAAEDEEGGGSGGVASSVAGGMIIDEVDEGNFFAEDPAIALLGAYGTALVAVIARVDGNGRLTP